MVIQKIASALNLPCTYFFVFSFFVENKKVCSLSSGRNVQFCLFNSYAVGPACNTHI